MSAKKLCCQMFSSFPLAYLKTIIKISVLFSSQSNTLLTPRSIRTIVCPYSSCQMPHSQLVGSITLTQPEMFGSLWGAGRAGWQVLSAEPTGTALSLPHFCWHPWQQEFWSRKKWSVCRREMPLCCPRIAHCPAKLSSKTSLLKFLRSCHPLSLCRNCSHCGICLWKTSNTEWEHRALSFPAQLSL